MLDALYASGARGPKHQGAVDAIDGGLACLPDSLFALTERGSARSFPAPASSGVGFSRRFAYRKGCSVMSQGGKGLVNKTFVATKVSAEANRAWWVVDATGKPLGRLASEVARVLRGKHKPTFTTPRGHGRLRHRRERRQGAASRATSSTRSSTIATPAFPADSRPRATVTCSSASPSSASRRP